MTLTQPPKYTITTEGEEHLLKLGDTIAKQITPTNVRVVQARALRYFQNEQYMLAKLASNPPLTRDGIIYGGPETLMLSVFNEMLRHGWIERT